MLLPHILWLNKHNFCTVWYALIERGALQHFTHWEYLSVNLQALMRIFSEMLLGFLAISMAIEYKTTAFTVSIASGARLFSFLLGLGPLLLFILLACILSFFTRATEWFVPFCSFLATYFFVNYNPSISKRSLIRYLISLILLMLATSIGYLFISLKRTEIYYPGPEIAQFATQLWHRHYATKLAYLGGNRYTAGYAAFYSSDKPQVWMEWDTTHSPWIDLRALRCKGALFITEKLDHTSLKSVVFPSKIRKTFPNLIDVPLQRFNWYKNPTNKPPIIVRFALLPPDKHYCAF